MRRTLLRWQSQMSNAKGWRTIQSSMRKIGRGGKPSVRYGPTQACKGEQTTASVRAFPSSRHGAKNYPKTTLALWVNCSWGIERHRPASLHAVEAHAGSNLNHP